MIRIIENGKYKNIKLSDMDADEIIKLRKGKFDPKELTGQYGTFWSYTFSFDGDWVGTIINDIDLKNAIDKINPSTEFGIKCKVVKTSKGFKSHYEVITGDIENETNDSATTVSTKPQAVEDKRYNVALAFIQKKIEKESKIKVGNEEKTVKDYIPEIVNALE